MAQFRYVGQLNGAENPVTIEIPINNSDTVAVGEAVKMDTLVNGGGVIRATAGSRIFGFVVGIVNALGIDLDNADPNTFDGTWTSSSRTYVAASDNLTDKLVKARVVIDKEALWENDTAGDLALADDWKFFDLTSATQVADQNGHDTVGALVLVRRPNPDDASVGVFKIAESAVDPYAQV